MAAKAGRLQVQMEMDIAQIKRDIATMTAEVKRASGQWKSDLDNFATGFKQGVIGAITGGAITAAVSAMVKDVLGKFDEIVDGAKKIGTSAEAFQELSYVAAQTGTDIDTVSVAVTKLEKNLYAAANGGGKDFKQALGDIGLTLQDLDKLTPDQQFRKIVDALSKIEDPAKRTGAAMQIFGKGATALGPMIAEGTEAIDALIAKAHDLGIVMSDEAVQAGEAFNDQLDTMRLTITGLVGNALGPMLPLLTETVAQMLNVATSTSSADTEMASFGSTSREVAKFMLVLVTACKTVGASFVWLGQTIGTALGAAVDKLGAFGKAWDQVRENAKNPFSTDRKNPVTVFAEETEAANKRAAESYKQIDSAASEAFANLGGALEKGMAALDDFKAAAAEPVKPPVIDLSDAMDAEAEAAGKATKAVKAHKEAVEKLTDAQRQYMRDQESIVSLTASIEAEQMKIAGATEREAEAYRLAATGASELALEVYDLQTTYDALADINDRNKQAAKDYQDALVDLTSEQMRANGATEDAITLYRQQALAMTDMERQAQNARDEADKAADNNRKRAQEAADLSQTLQRGVEDIFTGMTQGAKSATEAVKRLLVELLSVWATQKVMGFFPSLAAANGAAFDATGARFFSQGGIVSSPTPFTFGGGQLGVMGEAGSEAILPLARGTDGKLGVRGGGTNVTVHNYAGNSIETQAEGDNVDIIVRRVKDSMSQDVLRGGTSYTTAMERTYGLRR